MHSFNMSSASKSDIPDRSAFTTRDSVDYIWRELNLPTQALNALELEDDGYDYPSSFKIGHLAQASIALSALSAALVHALRHSNKVPKVTVPLRHACLEFSTETLFTIDGQTLPSAKGELGGFHATEDGHVFIHDSFPHHRSGTLRLLGLDENADREQVSAKVKSWKKLDLEEAAHQSGLVIYALRSYDEWDALPHASQVSNFPIIIRKIGETGPQASPDHVKPDADRCLRGLRALELSRVIAAPVAGKTLAAHGADVLWVTSPNLPDLPSLDRNMSRGKRTVQLDLNKFEDAQIMKDLLADCDVFLQGYRPQSLASKGFGAEDIAKLRPGIVYANLSAFGPSGPWADRRGFDSLVQTCTGLDVSEAEHYGDGSPARILPCQALDHAAGYFLATGISAALYKRATEGGSWEVHVSLAATMKYLRSLGQRPGKSGFEIASPTQDVPDTYYEERDSAFGRMRGIKHAANVEGLTPGWDIMPKPLGSDEPSWS